MQQIIILPDAPPQIGHCSGLCLKKVRLLIPRLLYLPLLPDHLAGLLFHFLNGLIVLVFDIHDLLCPDDSSIGDLDLVPQDIQRIRRHLLDNRNGLFRKILREETKLFCILIPGRACGVVVAGLTAPFPFSNVTIQLISNVTIPFVLVFPLPYLGF